MSVFIRKDAPDGVFSYDFKLRGRRFSGSTGETNRRKAEQFERLERDKAKTLLAGEQAAYAPEITIEAAAARYWHEVGQHKVNADTVLWSLDWLVKHFGAGSMLHDIGDAEIATAVAKRRGEMVPSQRKKGRKYKMPEVRRRVTPATVNRTMTQPLRQIMIRARDTWKTRVHSVEVPSAERERRARERSAARRTISYGGRIRARL